MQSKGMQKKNEEFGWQAVFSVPCRGLKSVSSFAMSYYVVSLLGREIFHTAALLGKDAQRLDLVWNAGLHLLVLLAVVYMKIFLWWDYFVVDIVFTIFPSVTKLAPVKMTVSNAPPLILGFSLLSLVFKTSPLGPFVFNLGNLLMEMVISEYNQQQLQELLRSRDQFYSRKAMLLQLLAILFLELSSFKLFVFLWSLKSEAWCFEIWSLCVFGYFWMIWELGSMDDAEKFQDLAATKKSIEIFLDSWKISNNIKESGKIFTNLREALMHCESMIRIEMKVRELPPFLKAFVAEQMMRLQEADALMNSGKDASAKFLLSEIEPNNQLLETVPINGNFSLLLWDIHLNGKNIILAEKIFLLCFGMFLCVSKYQQYLQY
jgi:hypothetical protein